MAQQIAISQVAKMLGIKRSELTGRLRAAGIETFEGSVDLDEVKTIAPSLDLCESDNLLRIRYLREDMSKKITQSQSQGATEAGNLEAELRRLSSELMVERRSAEHYLEIIVELAERLGRLQTSDNEAERNIGFEMCDWLRLKVNEE